MLPDLRSHQRETNQRTVGVKGGDMGEERNERNHVEFSPYNDII